MISDQPYISYLFDNDLKDIKDRLALLSLEEKFNDEFNEIVWSYKAIYLPTVEELANNKTYKILPSNTLHVDKFFELISQNDKYSLDILNSKHIYVYNNIGHLLLSIKDAGTFNKVKLKVYSKLASNSIEKNELEIVEI